MKFTTRDLQARLAALGFHPGPIDGLHGARTNAALNDAMADRVVMRPEALFHSSGLHRIHWHWTGGAYGEIQLELDHYNALIDQDGTEVAGTFPTEAQARYHPGLAASHTLNANTGAIGLAVDCMAGACERPFRAGRYPMTRAQLDGLVRATARLCRQYDIPVSRWSTLSHAEIQPTLGIPQRAKWDICWFPGMDRPGDPVEVGDRIRAMVRGLL
ncbi:N-acetylmuramoyl-L-alanine amidase [Thalassovita sp.]|uniref:peptidoglycan recognition protein family protein n=1 Tax=Thalassovita sp. TaxID=1979401 RepID=UPI002B278569|nr:N-acetylmuramoyl-L-alanine amidase [Thalassovita sp.]